MSWGHVLELVAWLGSPSALMGQKPGHLSRLRPQRVWCTKTMSRTIAVADHTGPMRIHDALVNVVATPIARFASAKLNLQLNNATLPACDSLRSPGIPCDKQYLDYIFVMKE